MKAPKLVSIALFISTAFLANTASAYETGKVEELCKKPKFYDFTLPVYKEPEKTEVPAESEFTVTISVWANPETIKLTAKNQDLDYTLVSNSSFHRLKAKLPAAFNGQFVRINVRATALLGCYDKIGWLIKVADSKAGGSQTGEVPKQDAQPAAPQAETVKPAETKAEASPTDHALVQQK